MSNNERSFLRFLWSVWDHLRLPEPTPLQMDIASYLETGPSRCIIQAFRGVGKSWITVAHVVWRLRENPETKIMVVSASEAQATQFTTFCKRLIAEMPELRHLKARDGQVDRNDAFDVGPTRASRDPSVKSVGITGQITGSRADLIIADDVETPKNSQTQGQRDRLQELVKEFDAVIKPGGRIVYLGTPQTEQSLYNLLRTRGYDTRIWPARYPARIDKYGGALAPIITRRVTKGAAAGSTTEPRRFPDDDLLARELSYGRSGFALQFMLDSSLSDADRYPLRLSDLVVMGLNPEKAPSNIVWASSPEFAVTDLSSVGLAGDRYYRPAWIEEPWVPYAGCAMHIDPSGRGKDETAYVVTKMLHGKVFLVAAGGFAGGFDVATVLEPLAKIAKQHQVNVVQVEPNFGSGMFTELLKPVLRRTHPCAVEDAEWVTTQKESRIIGALEPVMNAHRLVVDRSVIEHDLRESGKGRPGDTAHRYSLFYQMTRLTKESGCLAVDDRIDALAMGVAYWQQGLARDAETATKEARDAALKKELAKFRKHVFGWRPGPDRPTKPSAPRFFNLR